MVLYWFCYLWTESAIPVRQSEAHRLPPVAWHLPNIYEYDVIDLSIQLLARMPIRAFSTHHTFHYSFNELFRLPTSCYCSLILMSVTNSFSTARWILQLTPIKHAYSVTNVRFRYAKGVVLWKLNYEPKLILTWFAYRSYNPVSLFHLVEEKKQTELITLPPRATCRELLFPDLENWKGEFSLHWRPHHIRKK